MEADATLSLSVVAACPQQFSQRGRSSDEVEEVIFHRNHGFALLRDESFDGGIILRDERLAWGWLRLSVAKNRNINIILLPGGRTFNTEKALPT